MNNLIHFFSNEFVAALGWSLLHSLWQGALIALLLGIVLLFLQKQSSNLRYTLAASSLGLTLVAFFGTFAYLFNAAKAQQQAFNDTLYIVTQENYNELVNHVAESQSLFSIFLEYFNEHLPVIVVFWLLGVLVLSLRFLGGLAYLKRLRHTQNQAIGEHWQERLNSIKSQIGLNKSVQLLESALIKVPMVIGYMKPIVLLPIGTINALSAAEVEAILAHELAHIKRNDYLINLIQSIIDVLFFYHPAVWWMSNTVRTERENCCDDLALSVTGNSLIIAKALANLESLRQRSYHLSLAFTGNKNQLFNRISRLLGQPMKKNNHFVEGLVAVIVIILCLTTINYRVNAAVTETKEELTEMVQDSIIPKEEIIVNEGEEVIEEYIIIEEEIEMPVAPNAPFPVRWMKNADGNFELAEMPTAPNALLNNQFEFLEGTTTKWIRDDEGKLILKEFPEGSTRFFIPSPDDLTVIVPSNIVVPNHSFEMPAMPEMPEAPTWEEHSIRVMPSGTSQFLFDNSSNLNGKLFDENYEYKWKLKNKNGIEVKVKSLSSIADTSILDDAEVIIIDGDKITIVRKKGKVNASSKARLKSELKRLEHLSEIEGLRIEKELERAEALAERQLEAAERRLKIEEERLARQMEMVERKLEIKEEQLEREMEANERRLAAEEKRREREMAANERRLEMEERRKERQMEINERRLEMEEDQKIGELEKMLIEDGVLKSGEKIKTLNINENNGKVTIRVNGKKISEEKSKKYLKMLDKKN